MPRPAATSSATRCLRSYSHEERFFRYAIEQAIVDSGIADSFIRPKLFMHVLRGSTDSIAAEGVICEITGPDALSYADAAAMISLRVHREVRHVDVTPEQACA